MRGSSSCSIIPSEEFLELARDANDPILHDVWKGIYLSMTADIMANETEDVLGEGENFRM